MSKQAPIISASFVSSILLSAITILLGGVIYILLRSHEPQFFTLFNKIGIDNWLNSIRQSSLLASSIIPKWIVFSLPNGLWAMAYSLLITSIWSGSKSKIRYFWFVTIPVLVLGFEVLQLTEIIRGTFCIQDMVSGIVGIIIGIIVGNKISKIKNHETKAT